MRENATLGIIFSNVHDEQLGVLTEKRTTGSVPFGGRYRLIDFTLSNMVNSGVEDVGIIAKSNYQSLMDHVGNGKDWDLARKRGGLRILPPWPRQLRHLPGTAGGVVRRHELYPPLPVGICDHRGRQPHRQHGL